LPLLGQPPQPKAADLPNCYLSLRAVWVGPQPARPGPLTEPGQASRFINIEYRNKYQHQQADAGMQHVTT